jgi:hypothetical protein
LKVFFSTLATLLVLEADDFVERLSESLSDSGLLLDLVGRRIGFAGSGPICSSFSSRSSSFLGRGGLGLVTDSGLGFGGAEEVEGAGWGDLGDLGDADLSFFWTGDGGGLFFSFLGLSEETRRLWRGCSLPGTEG